MFLFCCNLRTQAYLNWSFVWDMKIKIKTLTFTGFDPWVLKELWGFLWETLWCLMAIIWVGWKFSLNAQLNFLHNWRMLRNEAKVWLLIVVINFYELIKLMKHPRMFNVTLNYFFRSWSRFKTSWKSHLSLKEIQRFVSELWWQN